MASKTITITPDFGNMFRQFCHEAESNLQHLARRGATTLTRKEVYDFVIAIRIAINCVQTNEDVLALRDAIDTGADAMFARVTEEQNA